MGKLAGKKLLLGTRAEVRELVVQKTLTRGTTEVPDPWKVKKGRVFGQKKPQTCMKVYFHVYRFFTTL